MSARLYIGNLPYDTDEARLTEIFAEFGIVITRPHIVIDKEQNRSKGFGFAEVATDKDAETAIAAMNGARIDGRTLRVDRAVERPRQPRADSHPDRKDKGGWR